MMLKEGELITWGKVLGHKVVSIEVRPCVGMCGLYVWVAAMVVAGDQEEEIAMEKMQKTVQLIKADEEYKEDSDNQRDKID